jgi:hypothetical protein
VTTAIEEFHDVWQDHHCGCGGRSPGLHRFSLGADAGGPALLGRRLRRLFGYGGYYGQAYPSGDGIGVYNYAPGPGIYVYVPGYTGYAGWNGW